MTEDHLNKFAKVIIEGVLGGELNYLEGVELLREIDGLVEGEHRAHHH